MISADEVLRQLREQCADVLAARPDPDRAQDVILDLPFYFADGDGIEIAITWRGDDMVITDHGATARHLETFDVDWRQRNRLWTARDAAGGLGVDLEGSSLVMAVKPPVDWYDVAAFVQAVTSFSTVQYVDQHHPVPPRFRQVVGQGLRHIVRTPAQVVRNPPADETGAYRPDHGILRSIEDYERRPPAVVTFSIGSSTGLDRPTLGVGWWLQREHGTEPAIILSPTAGLSAQQAQRVRDVDAPVIEWSGQGDAPAELHDLLDQHGVALAHDRQ